MFPRVSTQSCRPVTFRSCSENKCALRAHKTDPNISSEEQGMIVSRSSTAVPRLTGGRPSKEILIIEATIRNPIFMFGGAPQAHVELRSCKRQQTSIYKHFIPTGFMCPRNLLRKQELRPLLHRLHR